MESFRISFLMLLFLLLTGMLPFCIHGFQCVPCSSSDLVNSGSRYSFSSPDHCEGRSAPAYPKYLLKSFSAINAGPNPKPECRITFKKIYTKISDTIFVKVSNLRLNSFSSEKTHNTRILFGTFRNFSSNASDLGTVDAQTNMPWYTSTSAELLAIKLEGSGLEDIEIMIRSDNKFEKDTTPTTAGLASWVIILISVVGAAFCIGLCVLVVFCMSRRLRRKANSNGHPSTETKVPLTKPHV